MKILEQAFCAEVENRLPFQTRSVLADTLEVNGYLQRMEVMFGNVKVKGWQLTHLGHITYCASCA